MGWFSPRKQGVGCFGGENRGKCNFGGFKMIHRRKRRTKRQKRSDDWHWDAKRWFWKLESLGAECGMETGILRGMIWRGHMPVLVRDSQLSPTSRARWVRYLFPRSMVGELMCLLPFYRRKRTFAIFKKKSYKGGSPDVGGLRPVWVGEKEALGKWRERTKYKWRVARQYVKQSAWSKVYLREGYAPVSFGRRERGS